MYVMLMSCPIDSPCLFGLFDVYTIQQLEIIVFFLQIVNDKTRKCFYPSNAGKQQQWISYLSTNAVTCFQETREQVN